MIPALLGRYPATANPLPVAWDGQGVSWDEWAEIATFICARTLKKSRTACECCEADPKVSLVIHGHVGAEKVLLTLLRCPNCGADTVVDWNNNAWDLDESDYGPDGSWDDKPPHLSSYEAHVQHLRTRREHRDDHRCQRGSPLHQR